jgi:hypothetical protein
MRKLLLVIGIVLCSWPAGMGAQSAAQEPAPSTTLTPLKVRVVVSRYQGEKRVSTTPFEMSMRSDGAKAQLRMGNEVPVPFVKVASDGKQTDPPAGSFSFNYRHVGTNIDCSATPSADGRFRLDVFLEEVSVVADKSETPPSTALPGVPVFRTFRSVNTLLLKDEESSQFTLATDKLTGETIRVDVTLSVVKGAVAK